MTNVVFEPSQTTHWKNLFPNKTLLLGSHNLNEGEELVAKIASVSVGEIKDKAGNNIEKPILQFENAPPMVLNITNAETIACLYGDKSDQWIGKSIQLYSVNINAFGSATTALRVREAIPDTNEDIYKYEVALEACKSIDELKAAFMKIPKHLRPRMTSLKDQLKESLSVQD